MKTFLGMNEMNLAYKKAVDISNRSFYFKLKVVHKLLHKNATSHKVVFINFAHLSRIVNKSIYTAFLQALNIVDKIV